MLWLHNAVAELVSLAGTRRVPVRELVGHDDGRTPNGLNRTTGDRVTMTFDDGKIDAITFRVDVQGQHIPERLVKGRLADYTLDGVRWRPRVARPSDVPSLK